MIARQLSLQHLNTDLILSEVRRQPNGVEGPHERWRDHRLQAGISATDHEYWTYLVASLSGTPTSY